MRRALAAGFVFLTLSLVQPLAAQITGVTTDQSPPIPGAGHDYIHSLNEIVNPASGSVSVSIGVPLPTGRSSTLPFSFGYDSNSAHHFNLNAIAADNGGYLAQGGWRYVLPSLSYTIDAVEYGGAGGQTLCPSFYNYVFADARGTPHSPGLALSWTGAQQCGGAATPVLAVELTGADGVISASTTANTDQQQPPPVVVTDADGTVYHFLSASAFVHDCPGDNTSISPTPPYNDCFSPSYSVLPDYIEDRNGNKMVFTDSGKGSIKVADDLGRTVISTTGFGVSGNTVSISGLGGNYSMTWAEKSYDWTATVQQFGPSFAPNFNCNTETSVLVKSFQPELTEIALPNGQSYQFQYESVYGMLSKIIYPSGGYVRYVWGTSFPSAASFYNPSPIVSSPGNLPAGWSCESINPSIVVQHRYLSFDGTHEVLQQDFTYSTTFSQVSSPYTTFKFEAWSSKQTVVTTHDLVRGSSYTTTYNYTPSAPTSLVPGATEQWTGVYDTLAMESNVQITDFAGNLIRNVNETYGPVFFPPTDKKTTLETGSTSDVQNAYSGTSLVVLTDTESFDFGAATTGAAQPGAPGILLKHTHADYASFATTPVGGSIVDRPSDVIIYNGGGTKVAETDYVYDGPSLASVSASAHDDTYFPATFKVRGNATTVTRKCLQSAPACTSGSPVTKYTYDDTGKVATMTDPNLNATTYSYTDSYTSGTPSGNTNAYLTKITRPVTNGVNHISNFSYGYADGQLTVAKDENGQPTTYTYADSLDRLTSSSFPDGGGTSYSYNDTPPTPSVTATQLASPSPSITTVTTMDGMAHVTQSSITSVTPAIATTRTYDGLGRLYTVSNPHTTTASPTDGTTTYSYDSLGRGTSVAEQDGSTISTSYSGNVTTITDEASHTRETVTDGLGRLSSVVEDPGTLNYVTGYTYDALDDLLSVMEAGSRPRAFQYDSLGRLTSSSNPEISGAITFSYDANGNLSAKTAPAPNQTGSAQYTATMTYDAENRILTKSYTGGSPTATLGFTYDVSSVDSLTGLTFPIGRLVKASAVSSAGTTSYYLDYDKMGRTADFWNCVPSNCPSTWHASYTYDSAGQAYKYSDSIFASYSQTFDGDGRLTNVSSTYPSGSLTSLATVNNFFPPGEIQKMAYGNGLAASNVYNPRLQPCRITFNSSAAVLQSCTAATPSGNFVDFAYGYNQNTTSTSNNGSVASWTAAGKQTFSHNYTYDNVNRIFSMTGSGGSCTALNWTYDAWGNRKTQTAPPGGGTCFQPQFTYLANNQMSGYGYDSAGNLTSQTGATYTYDNENRLVAQNTSGVSATYLYDASGRRVQKTVGSNPATFYAYNKDGEVYAWLTPSGRALGYVYMNGQILAQYYNGSVYFHHHDHLGSTRLVTEINQGIQQCMGYYPFGEEDINQCTPSVANNFNDALFTGKERDSESNLDNFGARYYGSSVGRWMSPDVLNLTDDRVLNPANTLNKYVYGGNNPLKYIDPDGKDITYFYDQGGIAGHAILFAYNQATGDSALESFGPAVHAPLWKGESNFEMDSFTSADDLRSKLTSLTIQTSPETTQEVINYIRTNPDPAVWGAAGPNCSTQCDKILQKFKLDYQKSLVRRNLTPKFLWHNLMLRYNPAQENATPKNGTDYGNPRCGGNSCMFDLLWHSLPQSKPDTWDPNTNTLTTYY